MLNPVTVTLDGHLTTVDDSTLEEAEFKGKKTPNKKLKTEIEKWMKQHSITEDDVLSVKAPLKETSLNDQDYDYLFKFKLIGDSGVGKSCLLLRFADDTYTESYISTIGVDFKIRTIKQDNKTVKLQIWDTIGQNNKNDLNNQGKHSGAHGLILAVDLTDKVSFNNAKEHLKQLKHNYHPIPPLVLVGTKADLTEKQVVTEEELKKFAQEENLSEPIITSAKNGRNVDKVFKTLTQKVLNTLQLAKDTQISQAYVPKLMAFRKIYQALYDAETSIFKGSNFATTGEYYVSTLDTMQSEKPDSRVGMAWKLAQEHYHRCNKENKVLVREIYKYGFKHSNAFACSNVSKNTTFWLSSKVDNFLSKNMYVDTISTQEGSRTEKICNALK